MGSQWLGLTFRNTSIPFCPLDHRSWIRHYGQTSFSSLDASWYPVRLLEMLDFQQISILHAIRSTIFTMSPPDRNKLDLRYLFAWAGNVVNLEIGTYWHRPIPMKRMLADRNSLLARD